MNFLLNRIFSRNVHLHKESYTDLIQQKQEMSR